MSDAERQSVPMGARNAHIDNTAAVLVEDTEHFTQLSFVFCFFGFLGHQSKKLVLGKNNNIVLFLLLLLSTCTYEIDSAAAYNDNRCDPRRKSGSRHSPSPSTASMHSAS